MREIKSGVATVTLAVIRMKSFSSNRKFRKIKMEDRKNGVTCTIAQLPAVIILRIVMTKMTHGKSRRVKNMTLPE